MSDESRSRSATPFLTEQMENGSPPAQPTPQAQVPGRRRRAQQSQQQVQQQPLPTIGGDHTLSGPAGQAGQLLGNTLGQVTGGQQSGSGGKDTLKLRLDLNLDVDVQIKARIHGDVTLSLFVSNYKLLDCHHYKYYELYVNISVDLTCSKRAP
ncbi:hypothetical protein HYPSUDRAFT_55193 [Hypholoma sublateritium FD-334 SS-4]|uniref:Uncharacterized protein n=1 Tax=Hypholoma sublateritium (strain FD-334 SS-4) TaxID=945553 RepID=A0A0D2ME69_HYPSF|nr:hypothetical protein HYPSUDRAFT_55193 [Hypholoma sublateritium FD-334 SS-4]